MTLGQKLRACVRILMGEPTAFDVEVQAVGDTVAIAGCYFYGDTRIAVPAATKMVIIGNKFASNPKVIKIAGGPPNADAPEGEGGEAPTEEEAALEVLRKERLEKIESEGEEA